VFETAAAHVHQINWTAVAAISAAIGVILTLILNLRSQIQTRAGQRLVESGQKQEQEISEATAARAEAAAALTEGYTQRIVDALEAIARNGLGAPAGVPARVKWELLHHAGDTYRLTNIGNRKAWNIRLAADPTLHLVNPPEGESLDEDEALTFMAAAHMGTRDRTITVTWDGDDAGAEGGVWRYPLPGRPPR
jgi:ElaB/YqjD/DUF883 family membrane-anchored ribosome-binding protein